MRRGGVFYTVLITFVVSFVFIAVLAVANSSVKKKIEENRELVLRRTVLNAMGFSVSGTEEDYETYEKGITEKERESTQLFSAEVDGESIEGILFTGSGLWGTITGVISVNSDVTRVIGLDIADHNETPGLGGRIDEAWFKEQFNGEIIRENRIRFQRGGTGRGDPDHENSAVDAITGATRTSQALEAILERYLGKLKENTGGS